MKLVPGKGLDLNQDHIAMMGRKDFKLDPVYVFFLVTVHQYLKK